jgi:peptide chain release factor 1
LDLVEILRERVGVLEARRAELEGAVANPDAPKRANFQQLLQELGGLQKTLGPWGDYLSIFQELKESRLLAKNEDAELAELAAEEIPALEERFAELEAVILDRVLEDDEDIDKPALLEIRAGTGGDEAALFVADLLRIYQRYADSMGWSAEVLEVSESDMGGFKEVILKVSGDDAFRQLRFECGGHRVQRVPATETQGRIHTSAATVAVMPEVEALDFELVEEELEITAMRSSGPGGQSVNKTSSAIRIVHLPSGISVKCQVEKSQLRNKERALNLLRARLYEIERAKREAERSANRRSQVGTGDRSQRIRTYNWPQNRVTDHRLGSNFSLEHVLEGRLHRILAALIKTEREEKIASLNP